MARTDVLRRLIAWLIAAALIGFVFWRVPVSEAVEAIRTSRLDLFLPLVVISVAAWFLIESAYFAYLFSRLNTSLSWCEARALRAVTYLLTPIHWNLGKAAIVLRLRKIKRVPLVAGTSSLILSQTIDALVLSSFALVGFLLLPVEAELAGLRATTAAFVLALFAYLLLLRARRPGWQALTRLRGLDLHRAHRRARRRELFVLAAAKTAYLSVFVLFFFLGARAFGIELSLALALATTPLILALGALPITPAGLGTQQAAMLYFYGGRFGVDGADASIVAFGLCFPISLVVLRCLLGACYLAKVDGPSGERVDTLRFEHSEALGRRRSEVPERI